MVNTWHRSEARGGAGMAAGGERRSRAPLRQGEASRTGSEQASFEALEYHLGMAVDNVEEYGDGERQMVEFVVEVGIPGGGGLLLPRFRQDPRQPELGK